MYRWLRTPLASIRRRPLAATSVLALFIAGSLVGAHFYALHEFHEAQAALDTDHLVDASNHLSLCLTTWPWSVDTHLLAARIFRMRGMYEEATAQLDECRALQHGLNAQTELETLLIRAQNGEVDTVADGLLAQADQDDSKEQAILEALARGHIQSMHYLPALFLLNRCIARYPNDVRALDWHAWLMERLDQPEPAAREYEHLLTLAPDRTEARLRLTELYLNRSDPVRAEQHLKIVEKTLSERLDVQLALARCRYLEGRHKEARELLDKVLAAQPDSPVALLYRGKLELQVDPPHAEEAEGYFRRALKASPAFGDFHNALALSLRAQPGREAEADAELQKFNQFAARARRMQTLLKGEVDKPSHDVESAYELGKLNLDMGQEDLAVSWLRTSEKRDPNHQATHSLLADLAAKNGDMQEAARERALASGK